MDITPRHEEGMIRIDSYGARGFVVQSTAYEAALMIHGTEVHASAYDALESLQDITAYAAFLEDPICTMLLVGTGAHHHYISAQVRRALKEQYGIIVDAMNTGAACRTFNVLRSEGRAVDALLLPVR